MANAVTIRGLIVLCALTAGVPACGGGGGGGGSGGGGTAPPIATGLDPTTTPTAPLAASQAGAAALAAEIQDGATQLVKVASAPAGLPGTVGGVDETLQCSQLSTGGSGSVTIDENNFSGSSPIAGAWVEITYNDCTITSGSVTESINGSIEEEYARYSSPTDFAVAIAAINLTVDISGEVQETLNFSETLDVSNGTTTVSYTAANGGSLEITASDVVTSGNDVTITSATYVYQSAAGGGVVSAVYDNWEYDTTTGLPIGGSVTITGANGATVVIDATSSGYMVTYTVAGVSSSYTVTYP
jgi:hypothetical protein